MVLQNMQIAALTRSIQLAGDMWAGQHTNVPLPDWPAVPGEPDLEVMRPTEDAIPPRPHRVKPVTGPGDGEDDDGDDGGDGDDGAA
jgi:hypothetical protein